jgi:triacylglycerol esterase/lipase EstA (alpha/beta hydrolase family)
MHHTAPRLRRLALLAALGAAVAALLVPSVPARAATPPPPGIADLLPRTPPPGANDWSCRPTAVHPAPVVLVHGTFEGALDNWLIVAPQIKAAGYCVFALDYGNRGTGDIATSAAQLARFVDAVRAATGASKVSLVGHSQGGMMPRWYLKFDGGAAKVDDLVGLAPSNHGTTNPGALITGATFCPACLQQRAGSSFLRTLNAGDETPGAVSYTVVETSHDEVVTPFASAFLAPGPNTTNILIQDRCPADPVDHTQIHNDPVVLRWALQALGRPGPADPAHPPAC